MPGVLQIEAMAQAAGLMCMGAVASAAKDGAEHGAFDTILMSVDGAKFRRIVRPGDQLRIETTLVSRKGRIGKALGRITVDGNPAAECTMMFMLAPRAGKQT